MYLIVGLGNPGQQYAHTRHNVGFDVMAVLEKKLGVSVSREKGYSQTADCFVDGQKVILALPQTFMNLSGLAVRELMDYYKIPPENVLVIYDDIDIPQGTVRIRPNGSAGTHNGMRSIVAETGTERFPPHSRGGGPAGPRLESGGLGVESLSDGGGAEDRRQGLRAGRRRGAGISEKRD